FMNESSITIRWEKNADGGTDISVNGAEDGQTLFREAFLSVDRLPMVHDITERETSGDSAGNSATVALLSSLIGIIRKSNKTNGQIITEQMRNSKFPLTDLVAIRKFAEIAGIKFDEQKFRNWREFRMYFQSLLKQV
ncbi:hypothetical protein, partial [Muribaculum intestinale]|uniref:hypothetical protein n=1 Tax=Muribaculum intestinale TaxID=1796646 RepID=UPI0026EFE55C